MLDHLLKKGLVIVVIGLFIGGNLLPGRSVYIEEIKESSDYIPNPLGYLLSDAGLLDGYYIHNITENLSNIIFTEYDESAGELAKGRYFGTKGEHKAADILVENMSKLGLFAYKEPIKNLPSCPDVASKYEIVGYGMNLSDGINVEKVDCYIAYSLLGPSGDLFCKDCIFDYKGLKIRREHPGLLESKEDYVLIYSDEYTPFERFLDELPFNIPSLKFALASGMNVLRTTIERVRHPRYRGSIHIDCNDNCHDMPAGKNVVPRIFINGSVGERINSSIEDYTVDFYLIQRYVESVESYNVIGQLNGTDPSKTVIVGCLYDSWWCQGTADSAIGMGIVMGVAKYFMDNRIIPRYTIKFVGFAGEEAGMRGSRYYEAYHSDEDILYVIDLNQLGFDQEEPRRLRLEVAANRLGFLEEVWTVLERTNYKERTGDTTDIEKKHMPLGHISDDYSFASKRLSRPFCKTVCFLKNGEWLLHHRDGVGHTEGDVMKYYNWIDTNVTGEIVLNVTQHFAGPINNPIN